MTYPIINSTLTSEGLSYFFIYANIVTKGLFAPFLVVSFFLVVFISSIVMQLRFTAQLKIETSLLASSFATLGWVAILNIYSGILNVYYYLIVVAILILALIWNFITDN